MYFRILSPAILPTATAGRRWLSATSSSPFAAVLARIIPTPPESRMTAPFSTRALTPRSQSTTLPFMFTGSSVPDRHIRLALFRADCGYPWGSVGDASPPRAAVSCGASDKNTTLGRCEGANRDSVAEEWRSTAAKGEREDVHAVGDRTIDTSEDVGTKATRGPADLVGRDAAGGTHASGGA
ncbi:hypothetical protein IEQ34_019320 [Dendrobium chrysotoxum]|uniref:Uncharacterized protein n=1 Tax=Dendrobium chrysotoxum TaxID=161865 RepID=A0AAV7G6R6_DENCH|nr:hypothetical protein IEQ34_019320 [Dendrobium chrysotoxum]